MTGLVRAAPFWERGEDWHHFFNQYLLVRPLVLL